jgi:VWFA-related protein
LSVVRGQWQLHPRLKQLTMDKRRIPQHFSPICLKETRVTMRKSILALLLLFTTFYVSLAQGQQQSAPAPPPQTPAKPDQDDVVKITTNLVQVDAVVTKDGKPVRDLKAEDFELFEDGRKQQISSFAYISNIPNSNSATPSPTAARDKNAPPAAPLMPNEPRRVIALVVDDLGLSATSMATVRKQLRKFIDQELSPNDLIAIIRTGGTMGALQQFTNDRRLIDRALSQVKWNMCSRVGLTPLPAIQPALGQQARQVEGPCGASPSWSVVSTLRALRFIVTAMGEIPGRKSMIVFSDSLPREEQDFTMNMPEDSLGASGPGSPDNRSFNSLLQRIAEKAIRSSVVIYAVEAGGLQYTGLTAADNLSGTSASQMNSRISSILTSRSQALQMRREGAELIAKQTGGFLVRNSNDFRLNEILEDQSGYYLIGYRPTEETFNRRFHHIKARVKKSGMTLRTRYGFFGVSEDEVEKSKRTPTDKTTVALLSPFKTQELPMDLNAFFTTDKSGPIIRMYISINSKDLVFNEVADGFHEASVQLREMIFGSNGVIVDQQTFDRKISLKGETYERSLREGLVLHFDLPIKRPGAYQVRIAALDVTSAKVGAVGQFVEVPDLANHRLALSGIVMGAAPDAKSDPGATVVNPANRRFTSGSNVRFGVAIYNASVDPTTNQPNLNLQVQLYRDGKQVLSSPPMQVDTRNQTDLAHLVSSGVLRLNPELEPGFYYLQVIATDSAIKDKESKAIQWIDFEIVK